ncbi:hypothetical protein K469DRAFT_787112 [Zopfia rhizophila CBS 207.26]|uniref:HTH CENPB-type domain-containing protein n=1 Tax=Zopfia rhizophila CBS 207.26 TaxID=1314779 RepID=A0A6A6DV97_9PEZI|nr:hypothetical protein K469DRAFT_787112 [Zopfia rhizophila CBS 207.26]
MSRLDDSNAKRKALRQFYYNSKSYPRHKDRIEWFQQKYNHKIVQYTVSDSLSSHYHHLDDEPVPSTNAFRQRQANWPILESILFSWQQQIEYRGGLVSGELLAEKAKEI